MVVLPSPNDKIEREKLGVNYAGIFIGENRCLCIPEIYPNAFSSIQYNQLLLFRFTNLLYFSIVTFTTVGYGDITPVIPVARLLSIFEMVTAFVVIVFIISKYFKNK